MKDAIKARPMKGLDESQFKEGDWVIANLKRHGMNDASGHFAEITEYVTHNNDPEAPWWVVLRRHDLPRCAPDIEQEWQLRDEGLTREDLTALPFVTIDGESTRDMDDALYIEKPLTAGKCWWPLPTRPPISNRAVRWIWKRPNGRLPSICRAAIFR